MHYLQIWKHQLQIFSEIKCVGIKFEKVVDFFRGMPYVCQGILVDVVSLSGKQRAIYHARK